jgi:hypothetical protein
LLHTRQHSSLASVRSFLSPKLWFDDFISFLAHLPLV